LFQVLGETKTKQNKSSEISQKQLLLLPVRQKEYVLSPALCLPWSAEQGQAGFYAKIVCQPGNGFQLWLTLESAAELRTLPAMAARCGNGLK